VDSRYVATAHGLCPIELNIWTSRSVVEVGWTRDIAVPYPGIWSRGAASAICGGGDDLRNGRARKKEQYRERDKDGHWRENDVVGSRENWVNLQQNHIVIISNMNAVNRDVSTIDSPSEVALGHVASKVSSLRRRPFMVMMVTTGEDNVDNFFVLRLSIETPTLLITESC
jgi:hypothetical protein